MRDRAISAPDLWSSSRQFSLVDGNWPDALMLFIRVYQPPCSTQIPCRDDHVGSPAVDLRIPGDAGATLRMGNSSRFWRQRAAWCMDFLLITASVKTRRRVRLSRAGRSNWARLRTGSGLGDRSPERTPVMRPAAEAIMMPPLVVALAWGSQVQWRRGAYRHRGRPRG